MAREPENCQNVARDCQRALYCPKTICDDVRSVVLVETLLYNEFVTCQPNHTCDVTGVTKFGIFKIYPNRSNMGRICSALMPVVILQIFEVIGRREVG